MVLVTANESMPAEHAAVLAETHLTVAVLDGAVADEIHPDHWKRDIVHRWAHSMERQQDGTIRRYSPLRHGLWTERRRPVRRRRTG